MDHVTQGRHAATHDTPETAHLPGFEHVDLANSRVHTIQAEPGRLTAYLDAALTSEHPEYGNPRAGTAFDYRSAQLRFDHVTDLTWSGQRHPEHTGFYGEPDHGGVTSFRNGFGHFELIGDFGVVTVRGFDVRLTLLEDRPTTIGLRARREADLSSRHTA